MHPQSSIAPLSAFDPTDKDPFLNFWRTLNEVQRALDEPDVLYGRAKSLFAHHCFDSEPNFVRAVSVDSVYRFAFTGEYRFIGTDWFVCRNSQGNPIIYKEEGFARQAAHHVRSLAPDRNKLPTHGERVEERQRVNGQPNGYRPISEAELQASK